MFSSEDLNLSSSFITFYLNCSEQVSLALSYLSLLWEQGCPQRLVSEIKWSRVGESALKCLANFSYYYRLGQGSSKVKIPVRHRPEKNLVLSSSGQIADSKREGLFFMLFSNPQMVTVWIRVAMARGIVASFPAYSPKVGLFIALKMRCWQNVIKIVEKSCAQTMW